MNQEAFFRARSRFRLNTLAISLPLPRAAPGLDRNLQSEGAHQLVDRLKAGLTVPGRDSGNRGGGQAGPAGQLGLGNSTGPDRSSQLLAEHLARSLVGLGRPCPSGSILR